MSPAQVVEDLAMSVDGPVARRDPESGFESHEKAAAFEAEVRTLCRVLHDHLKHVHGYHHAVAELRRRGDLTKVFALYDAETRAWIAGQETATRRVLDAVPGRDWLRAQLRRAASYPRRSVPMSAGPGREFCWEGGEGDEKLRHPALSEAIPRPGRNTVGM